MHSRFRCVLAVFTLVAACAVTTGAGVAVADPEPAGQVSLHVFFDRNRSRWQDPGEPHRVGAKVTARHLGRALEYTARTDDAGRVQWPALPVGTYEVSANDTGYNSVTWNRVELEVREGRPTHWEFPQIGSVIFGRAWDDLNGDGARQDQTEPRRQTTFTVLGETAQGSLTRTHTSDSNGEYRVEDLPSGTYFLQATAPSGMRATQYRTGPWYADNDFTGTPPATALFTVAAETTSYNIDAGFAPLAQ